MSPVLHGRCLGVLEGHHGSVAGVLPLGPERAVSWSKDATLRLWGADGTPLATLAGHSTAVAGAARLGLDRLVSWSADGTLRIWDGQGEPLRTLSPSHGSAMFSIADSPGTRPSRSRSPGTP